MNIITFEEWLIQNDDKTVNSAYSYKNAIPKLSKHFSEQTNSKTLLEEIDIEQLEEISEEYTQTGIYSDFGSNSKGINRNALIAFVKYRKYLKNDKNQLINVSIFQSQIAKYQNAIDKTDWLKVHESYKFYFIKWIENNLDFKNDTNEAIKAKIEESQQQVFSPNSNVKGVNFIQTIIRYQDDYITIQDIEKLKFIIADESSVSKENLTLSFSSFPKTSAYLCLFAPEKFMAYDGESLPAYEFLSNGTKSIGNIPKRNYKAFRFYQTFYKKVKQHLKESDLNTNVFRELLQVETLTELNWNFITQDFLLYVTREIMNKEINTIDIKGSKIYKLSMGSFLKDKAYEAINPIEQFEKNNLVVMHGNTSNNQGYSFVNALKKGDYIYVTYGQRRLSFIGKITGEAEQVNKVIPVELDDGWISRSIEIIKEPVIDNTNDLKEKLGWLPSGYSTFKEIKDIDSANKILFNKYYNVDIVDSSKNHLNKKINFMNNFQPLNQILYGPPGTGKTYKTKKLAVEIIENQTYSDSKEDREIILKKYNEYVESENIHFTTFHQSMSYEDFIEGIKPKMNEDEEAEMSYEVQEGIFKIICNKAKEKENVIEDSDLELFDIAWDKLIYLVKEKLSIDELLKIGSWEYGLSSKESLKYESLNSPSKYTFTITKKNIYDTYQNKLARPSGAFQKDMKEILNFMKSQFKLIDFEELDKDEQSQLNQKYVLIIDEINRGNVSAIFGELITLIEKDKRAGEDEAISVTLPYSKDKFSVPQNVFIIGTMNTADRSVEALDTALRRRFSFEEILPKPHLLNKLEYQDVNLELLLSIINQRIELLIDKDHQIGHSYFLNVNSLNDLKLVFKDKIIPLLEEYFYGDLGKIGLVLGERFIKPSEVKNKSILAKFKDYNDIDFVSDKKVFRFCPINEMEEMDFISIYQSIEG